MDLSFIGHKDELFTEFAEDSSQFSKAKIHVRLQDQKNRKLTIVEGLDTDLDLERIGKAMKRAFSCSSKVQKDEAGNELILLQGDQRMNVKSWLIEQEILTAQEAKDRLVLHGF